MKCPKCGRDNPNDSQFCNGCGLAISPQQAPIIQANALQPTMDWLRMLPLANKWIIALTIGILILMVVISLNRNKSRNKQSSVGLPSQVSEKADTRITKANFENLKEGMTLEQVITLLGSITETKYEAKDRTGSAGIYQWGTADQGFIICTFNNNKLASKSQVSLKY